MKVVKVYYEYATPTFDNEGTPGKGWISTWKTVLIDGEDTQAAVDLAREYELNRREKSCSPDAPINTVKDFRLSSVEFICNIDLEA